MENIEMKSIYSAMRKSLFGALLVAVMSAPGVSNATAFTDLAAWEAAVGSSSAVDLSSYVGTTVTAGTSIDLAGAAGLSFDADVLGMKVGAGWHTWAGGRTPDILHSLEDTITATFSPGLSAFGFVMEPNSYNKFTMQLNLSDGTSITQSVVGDSGAAFFGWSGQFITSMTILCGGVDSGSCLGFAMGEMVVATAAGVPEAGSLVLLSIGLLALGAGTMRRRNNRA
jgi:hypothetical protein